VKFLRDPYAVSVDLRKRRLHVWKSARLIVNVPVGVGRSVTPTPAGIYFLVELIKQADPNGSYGPYAFGTSAYSNVLQTFGGGPGQVGIHGTNEPQFVGTYVSHGCIRLRNRDIVRLAHMLPLGTPVYIHR
jgi:lipoprotein-anchoring transpeptidase ErfK/SrfK